MSNIIELAKQFNKDLKQDHIKYLTDRGLSIETVNKYLLGVVDIKGEERITIPIFDIEGNVLFFKCRIFKSKDLEDSPKYIYYHPDSKEDKTASIYGIETLDDSKPDEKIIITEGEFDSLVLRQRGYLAISGTGGCGTFPDQWSEKIKRFSEVYITYDNDEAGKRESIKVAKKLKNNFIYLLSIPEDLGVKDISEYFVKYPDNDFSILLKNAKVFDPDSFEFADFEITEGRKEFIPPQYFTNSTAYISLKLHTIEKEEYYSGIYVISSDRKIAELETFSKNNNYYIARKFDVDNRWSSDSIVSYLKGKNPALDYYFAYEKSLDILKYYLDLGSETLYKVVVLWLLGTYFYRQFRAYPYFNVNGLMNSGKSKMLELCSLVAFNGEFLMGSTPAYIIRSINDNCSTIFLDEAEKLKDTSNPDSQTLIYMLNSGYKAGAKIGKMTTSDKSKGWNQIKYDPYSPKMIAGVNNISDTLISRSINITLIASDDNEIKNREVDTDSTVFQNIRDALYFGTLQHFQLVREAYESVSDDYITGRNWEVWKPILSLACTLDELRGDNEPTIYKEVTEYAKTKIKVYSQISEESQSALQLLLALKGMMESDQKEEEFYPTENIKTYLVNYHSDEFGWLSESSGGRYLGPTLRKTGVIEGGSRVQWFDTKAMRGYDLNLKIICHRLKALGVDI